MYAILRQKMPMASRSHAKKTSECPTEDSITRTSHVDKICRPIVKEYLLHCQNVICCAVKRRVLQHTSFNRSCIVMHLLTYIRNIPHSSWVNIRLLQYYDKVPCFYTLSFPILCPLLYCICWSQRDADWLGWLDLEFNAIDLLEVTFS